MTDYEMTSIVLIAVVTIGLSIYDVLPATNEVDADTLSAIMHLWSRQWWIIPFIWSVLAGHWFGGHPVEIASAWPILLWLTWALFVVNLGTRHVEFPWWFYLAVHVLGWFVGHFLWSQADQPTLA
jgi:hypothetical protein